MQAPWFHTFAIRNDLLSKTNDFGALIQSLFVRIGKLRVHASQTMVAIPEDLWKLLRDREAEDTTTTLAVAGPTCPVPDPAVALQFLRQP